MAKYGYIENGFLRAREVEQGQVQNLSSEWKPVDDIDESKTISDDDNHTIRLVPYDNGNRISFNYEKVVNTTKIQGEIDAIKAELSETDYQVIKCYEALSVKNCLMTSRHCTKIETRSERKSMSLKRT